MLSKYECFMQEEINDCGIACLLTILKTYKIEVTRSKILSLVNKNKQGISALDIINVSKYYGFNAKGIKCNISDLPNSFPMIAYTINNNYFHFIVVHNIDYINNSVIIADPDKGLHTLTIDELNKVLTGIYIIFSKGNIKKEKDKRLLYFIRNVFKHNKTEIFLCLLVSLICILCTLLFNTFLKNIINYLNYKYLFLVGALLFLNIGFVKNIFDYIKLKLFNRLNLKLDYAITKQIYKHILFLPYKYYLTTTTGELLTTINDMGTLKEVVSNIIIFTFIDVLFFIFIIIFILVTNYILGLFLLVLFLIYLVILSLSQNKFNNILQLLKKNNIILTSGIIESINNIISIKNLNLMTYVNNNLNNNYLKYENSLRKYNNLYINNISIRNLINDCFLVISILVTYLFLKISINEIILFNSLFYLFISSLNNFFDNFILFKNYKISINRVLDLIEVKEEKVELKKIVFNKIIVNNLDFIYENKYVLKNVNLEINMGEKILILGPSGCGKSTLIKLLLKYYKISNGTIYLDSVNINDVSSYELRNKITYVSQEEELFNNTIKDNIFFNQNEDSKIYNISLVNKIFESRKINSTYFINNELLNLSGGEKNSILIARALAKDNDIIIFDESFGQLDMKRERTILYNIFNNYPNKTIIVISHREQNKDLFNKIIKLRKVR